MGETISVETGSMVDSAVSTAVENAKRDGDSVIIEESDAEDGERKLAMASGQ
jgi:hypothetical protein